jgi:hypothetical protein
MLMGNPLVWQQLDLLARHDRLNLFESNRNWAARRGNNKLQCQSGVTHHEFAN